MPTIFDKLDKIKPIYDMIYKVILFICKILLILDIAITSMAVAGRYISFIPDPSWSEEIVLTFMAYMAVLSAALAIRRGAHIRMTALDNYLPKALIKFLDILAALAGTGYDRCRLAVCNRTWCQRLLHQYPEIIQILDVLPGSVSRYRNAGI